MHSVQMVCSRVSEKNRSHDAPGIQSPATTAASVRTPPMSDASTTRPGRMRYIHSPTSRAIGIVQAMVNVPHELPGTTWEQSLGRVYVGGTETGNGSLFGPSPLIAITVSFTAG